MPTEIRTAGWQNSIRTFFFAKSPEAPRTEVEISRRRRRKGVVLTDNNGVVLELLVGGLHGGDCA